MSVSAGTPFVGDCRAPGIFEHRVVIPSGIPMPVLMNIRGSVNDDLLIDGESITDELLYDPFEYPSALGGCVGAHAIGEGVPPGAAGPFSDLVNGGITIPWNKRDFIVACRDTVGFGAGLNITTCKNLS